MKSRSGDLLSVLERRADVLDALMDGPEQKRGLVKTLNVSRSTVDRAIRKLEAYDMIQRSNGEITITFLGRLGYVSYVTYRREILKIDRYGEVLKHLDSKAPVPPFVLEGADLYQPEPPATHQPIETARRELSRATTVRGLVKTITDPAAPKQLRDELQEGDIDVELIGTGEIIDHLLNTWGEEVVRGVRKDVLSLSQIAALPFGLFVFDPDGPAATVLLLVYDGDGNLAGVLRNRRGPVVDWAMAFFRRRREGATSVTPTQKAEESASANRRPPEESTNENFPK
jgi:predicted transcriptional regulator